MNFESLNMLNLVKYKGIIGIPYNSTLEMILIYVLLLIITILTLIGLFTVLKRIFRGKKKKGPAIKKNPNWP